MKIGYSRFLNSLVNAKLVPKMLKFIQNPALYTVVFIVFFPSYFFLPLLNILYHCISYYFC